MKEKLLKNTSSSTASSKSPSTEGLLKILKIYKEKNESFLITKIGQNAYSFLDDSQRRLLLDSLLIKTIFTNSDYDRIVNVLLSDFSVVVFPSAKAFEGYIKKLLLTIGLITEKEIKEDPYKSIIGRILNGKEIKKKLLDKKRGRNIPKLLAVQWELCRNIILHYDLDQPEIIKKEEAFKKIEDIYEVIKKSCKAFISTPKKIKNGLTAKKLRGQIDILSSELQDLRRQLSDSEKKET